MSKKRSKKIPVQNSLSEPPRESLRVTAGNRGGRRRVLIAVFFLFGTVLALFLPAIKGAFLYFDDNAYVVANAHVNTGMTGDNVVWAFTSFEKANWHPLTWLSHMMDVQIYGMDPWGHHLTNVLLHAINTVLVFLVFRRMTGAGWPSFLVALLFGLHPLRVQSVAWISERKDVLCGFFWFAAMWTYVRYAEETKKAEGRTRFFYLLTLIFFVLGLMSKTMLVTLPCVFLLMDYWPLNRWKQGAGSRVFFEKVPFFLLTAAISVVAYVAQQKGGMIGQMPNVHFVDRIGNALIGYVRYLGKLFWPAGLCIDYPHPGRWPSWQVIVAALMLGAISVVVWVLRRKRPYLFVGWLWYLGTLVPVIGLVQLASQSMADRYTYIPAIGICWMAAWGGVELARHHRYRVVLPVIVAFAGIACAIRTSREIGYWRNDVTVWRRAATVLKDNFSAHNNLGIVLAPTNSAAAFIEFQEAVRENPYFSGAQKNLADQFLLRGQWDDAILHYQKALEIEPGSVWAEHGLGQAYEAKGQMALACYHFNKAIERDPTSSTYENALGVALMNDGRTGDALIHFEKAVRNNPRDADAQYDLGSALLNQGRIDEAIDKFQTALILKPDFAYARSNLDLAVSMKALGSRPPDK